MCSYASVYYIERKPKNKKRGGPGNDAKHTKLIVIYDFFHAVIDKNEPHVMTYRHIMT